MEGSIHNDQAHQQRVEENRIARIHAKFLSKQPPTFTGELNPTVAEDWLVEMKKMMEKHKVPDDLKVRIACSYLVAEAHRWWKSIESILQLEVTRWSIFEAIFLEKFSPSTIRDAKIREFIQLIQRDLTVAEYKSKFEELLPFAAYLVPDVVTKVKRFVQGLKPTIRQKIEVLMLEDYNEVVERALIAERGILETKRLWSARNETSERTTKRQKWKSSRATQDPKVCFQCQQVGHFQRSCPQIQFYQAHPVPQPRFPASFQAQQNWSRPPVDRRLHYEEQCTQSTPSASTSARQQGQLTHDRSYMVEHVASPSKALEGTLSK